MNSSQFPVLSSQKDQCEDGRPRPSKDSAELRSAWTGQRPVPTPVRWLKFNGVGGVGIVVQLAALALFRSVLHLDYLLATALAVETAVLHNFLWHERFTWADRPATHFVHSLVRLAKFNISNGGVSIVGNLLLMRLLVGELRLNYLVSNLIAIAVCSLVNFLLSDRFVFERKADGRNFG